MRQWLMCRGAFKQRTCILQCEGMVGTFQKAFDIL